MKTDLTKQEQLPAKKKKPELITAEKVGRKKINIVMADDLFTQTGCKTYEGAAAIIQTSVNAFLGPEDSALVEKEINDHLALMAELKPQDPFESLLISQMLMVHQQALHNLSISNLDENRGRTDIQDSLTSRYVKLMRLYALQMESLDKHRRGGKQKMTVEHVTVNAGGQAVVGSVNQGGGKDEK